jgi:geranylgeranyl transferase type-2 subunit beta
MPSAPYLVRLTARLADGLARIDTSTHVRYLLAAQRPDGGFAGREGESDLYYTGFALRGLAVTGALTPDVAERAGAFLRGRLTGSTGLADFFSLLYAALVVQTTGGPDVLADAPPDWPDRVAALLASLRTPDGGYAKSPGSAMGSTYNAFLVALCHELLGRPVPQPEDLERFIRSRQRDGGFLEMAVMKRPGTNPTAAGIGVLQLLDTLDPATASAASDYLLEMVAEDEGGFRANDRIPFADVLSTFTALWTLEQLGQLDRADAAAARSFAEGLAQTDGGFAAGMWDAGVDVEYTFYGLGVLGLLAPE